MMPDMLRRRATPVDIAGLVLVLVSAAPLHAQPPPSAAPPGAQSGPAPPTLPDTIARDTQGRATLRAVRATTPLRQDGRLDETRLVSTNARLRWEYRPGSEIFVVFNEERDNETVTGVPSLQNRALIVKVNRFFRF